MEFTILEIERRGRTGNRRSSRRRAGSSSRVGEDTEPKHSKEPRDALPEMVEKEGASQALYHVRLDWEWRKSRTRRV